MKLLCLHGYGTNGECFKSQMLPTLNALGGEHELVFLDGELKVGKSVFTGNFDPPYLAYYEDALSASTVGGHQLVEEAIEADGPFDGIVGFSQGAGLAVAYMLHQRMTKPDEPPKFKFALLFSTSFIVSPDPEYKKKDILQLFENLNHEDVEQFHGLIFNPASAKSDFENAPYMEKLSQAERDLFKELGWEACNVYQTRNQLHINDKVTWIEKLRKHELPPDAFPRFLNPVYTTEKLNIPTVHAWGRNDSAPLRRLAQIGRGLCEDGDAIVVEHSGRHELPTRREDAMATANAVEKAFFLGQQHAITV